MVRGSPCEVRSALARVLAAPGTEASWPLRAELLDVVLEYEEYEEYEGFAGGEAERDHTVLDAVLRAAALGAEAREAARTRELVRRAGALLVRTPEGAACFDRRLVALARELPGFARLVAGWLEGAPGEWAAMVGPSSRRMVGGLGQSSPSGV
jgi:hypothetical protein